MDVRPQAVAIVIDPNIDDVVCTVRARVSLRVLDVSANAVLISSNGIGSGASTRSGWMLGKLRSGLHVGFNGRARANERTRPAKTARRSSGNYPHTRGVEERVTPLRAATVLFLLAIPCVIRGPARVTNERPATARALADSINARFQRADTIAFADVFPFPRGRDYLAAAVRDRHPTVAELARVVEESGDSATLLLGGFVRFRSTGDETLAASAYSGLYRAARSSDGGWQLARPLPMKEETRVLGHRINVRLVPGWGLEVLDSLDLEVATSNGAVVHLNHAALLDMVRVGGGAAGHVFGGGVLWLEIPLSRSTRVVLRYRVNIARDSAAPVNSGRFLAQYGHVRGQYMWHPMIWFDDAATFRITVLAPGNVRVATDLPQRDAVHDGARVVRGDSRVLRGALSLFYDRGWMPVERDVSGYRFAIFATPDFKPSVDTLVAAFRHIVGIYTARFGAPQGSYLAIVQQRARPGEGWLFRSNDAIAASANGWLLQFATPQPGTPFGHEIAHGWTHPTGEARMFLSEGWANFAASLVLRDAYGRAVEANYWQEQRDLYLKGDFEGKVSLWNDPLNSGVAYGKGSFVLRMLEEEIGQRAFDRGMRSFVAIPSAQRQDYAAFLEKMAAAAGRDLRDVLAPWVEGTHIPELVAAADSANVTLSQKQEGPAFHLKVELALYSKSDSARITIPLEARTASVPVPSRLRDGVTRIVIDPDHRLLLR